MNCVASISNGPSNLPRLIVDPSKVVFLVLSGLVKKNAFRALESFKASIFRINCVASIIDGPSNLPRLIVDSSKVEFLVPSELVKKNDLRPLKPQFQNELCCVNQ